MFMFPEPPPLDHRLTDIGPSFVADGIFYHEKPSATHKYVAKQLTPIKRKVCDPLAPIQKLNSHTLDQWVKKEELYVAHVGKDEGKVFETFRLMPKSGRKDQKGPQSHYSIFPRSPQYELWFIQERRAKDFAKRRMTFVECSKTEPDDEAGDQVQSPIWSKRKSGKPKPLPIGNINDYSYRKLKNPDAHMKISEKLEMDNPAKYIPGDIHRQTNPEDRSMQDTLERADTFKVVLKADQPAETIVEKLPAEKFVCPITEPPPLLDCCNSKARDDANDLDSIIYSDDKRWHPPQSNIGFLKNDRRREQKLRDLTKPFSHDLHTWYTINKPAELIIPFRRSGKRFIPERVFSHL